MSHQGLSGTSVGPHTTFLSRSQEQDPILRSGLHSTADNGEKESGKNIFDQRPLLGGVTLSLRGFYTFCVNVVAAPRYVWPNPHTTLGSGYRVAASASGGLLCPWSHLEQILERRSCCTHAYRFTSYTIFVLGRTQCALAVIFIVQTLSGVCLALKLTTRRGSKKRLGAADIASSYGVG